MIHLNWHSVRSYNNLHFMFHFVFMSLETELGVNIKALFTFKLICGVREGKFQRSLGIKCHAVTGESFVEHKNQTTSNSIWHFRDQKMIFRKTFFSHFIRFLTLTLRDHKKFIFPQIIRHFFPVLPIVSKPWKVLFFSSSPSASQNHVFYIIAS